MPTVDSSMGAKELNKLIELSSKVNDLEAALRDILKKLAGMDLDAL